MAVERIQKILAAAGFGARRFCEQLVLDSRVSVNGEIVRSLPVLVDPEKDRVTVDGKPVRAEKHAYYLLHKPRHVFCTHDDPAGRTRAVDLLVGVRERVFPVGRLDAESTGLLLLTNDGDLTQRLTHPRYGIPKTYRVEVAGCPTTESLDRLRAGIWLSEGKTSPATITIAHKQRDRTVLEITLREARNREIRRVLAGAGHKVRRLARIRIGKLTIRGMPVGAYRKLTPAEVEYLRSLSDRGGADAARSARRKRSTPPKERPRPPRPPRGPSPRPKRRILAPDES